MKLPGTFVCLTALLAGMAGAQQVNLRFSTWAGGDGLALLQQLSKEYSAQNPGVQVTVEVTPFADYGRKLAIQVASGDAPDVGWLAERDVPTFLGSKAVLDLSAELSRDKAFNLADFPLSTLSLWKRGSAVYGVPFSNSPLVLFYNKDLFQAAGVKDPLLQYSQATWDYAHFQQASKAIKDKTGAFGARVMRLDPKAWAGGLLAVAWSQGGGVYDKAMKCQLDAPGTVSAFQLASNMMFKDASMPRPGDQTAFESGRIGMYFDNLSYSAQLKDAKFRWGVSPLPKGTAGRVTQLGQAGYVVFSKSRNQAEAVKFLKFLASAQTMARTARFFPPPRLSILKSAAYLSSNPAIPASTLKTAVVAQLPSARVLVTGTDWLRANDAITSGLDRVFQANANIPAVLDDLCKQIDGF
ncbi:ABC transporter substrate-binding protein [Deinococcus aquiradiocola]|uniref:Sugar ABC transporter substrate-binding protein n=1 Tax=Deinococcus aquiradiocola TaxID=393059 RepID=A0A917PI51_9DEIO|nr:sugar ABC transporter substrate-binding protein [Deinococcus aquiradiocola]GGJ78936.1 sugar ABC transporter substrate-binding protein [Deinococcus aquiradiocola]